MLFEKELVELLHIEKEDSILLSIADSLSSPALDAENLDTVLNLLSYSRDKQILTIVIKHISTRIKDELFLVGLIEHGAVNAFILFLHRISSLYSDDQELTMQGMRYLNKCIVDPIVMDPAQIPPLALVLSKSLSATSFTTEFRLECINLAKKCSVLDSFCESFFQYLSQTETARIMNTLEISVKLKLIDLFIDIFSSGSRTKLLNPNLTNSIMQSFSSSFHSQTSQMWLKLLISLVKDLRIAKEFMRFGGLKVLLALLKIPHMDIVFSSVRVLKTLAAHGIIAEEQYGNSTRQQLIHLLGGVKYEYEQKQNMAEEAKKAMQISKQQLAKTLKTQLRKERSDTPSQGKMMAKLQKDAEERKLKEEESKKKELELLAGRDAAAAARKSEIIRRMESNQKDKEKQKKVAPKAPDVNTKETSKMPAKKTTTNVKKPVATKEQPVVVPVAKEVRKAPRVEMVLDEEPEIMEDWKGKLTVILDDQLSNPNQSQTDRLNSLIALQKIIIQYSLDEITAHKISDLLVPLLKVTEETIIVVHACTISYYMLCQPDIQQVLFYTGVIKSLADLLKGYNLMAIEHALWSLDIFCGSEANINDICGLGVISSLGVVVDSSITNIRLHAQSILTKIAKLQKGDSIFYEQIKELRQKNPWSQLTLSWKEDVWHIPLAQ